MAKNNFFAICWGRRTGVYDSWDETKKHIHKYPDANYKGFPTKQEALAFFRANYATVQAETGKKRNAKFAVMRAKRKCNQPSKVALEQAPNAKKPTYKPFKKLVLTCHFGGKNTDTTITGDNGDVVTVQLSQGATRQRKVLELTNSALQWAERAIEQGTDLVEVWGVDSSVLVTLNDWAPGSRERNWTNASGKPFANRDLIEPMLSTFEKLGDKVTLNTGEQPVDNDAPF